MKLFLLPFLVLLFANSMVSAGERSPGSDDGTGSKSVLCGGVERWAVKVLTDAAAAQVNYSPRLTTLDSLVHITTSPNQNAPRMPGIEFQSYLFTCNITVKKNEDDDDYHLVLKSGSETMIGEVHGAGKPCCHYRVSRFSSHFRQRHVRKMPPGDLLAFR